MTAARTIRRGPARALVLCSGVLGALALAGFGCNSILENRPGELDPSALSTTDAEATPRDAGATTNEPDRGSGCPEGASACNAECVDAYDPAFGCGAPDCRPCAVAHATAACHEGACTVGSCDPGHADCNGDPRDGCEVELASPDTCGDCTRRCKAEAPLCAPSGSGFGCVTGCSSDAPLLCNGRCTSPASDVNHCGGCDGQCAGVANAAIACVDGGCTFTCNPKFHACGAACVPDTDPAHCGPACTACPTPANGEPTCAAGACGIKCSAGFGDCNADPKDGCEAKLDTDERNCGACGRSCDGGTCKSGECNAIVLPL